MSTTNKSKTDQNTDGKGAPLSDEQKKVVGEILKTLFSDEADNDNADHDGSDTSTDSDEGKDEADDTTNEADADDSDESDDADGEGENGGDEDADDDADSDEQLPGDDGKPKFTQSDVNKFVTERVQKERTRLSGKHKKEVSKLQAKLSAAKKQLEGYLKADKDSVQAAFDSLPEEIRELAPASLKTAEGIAKVKSWLPKGQKLAEAIAGKGATKIGNGNDFKPLGSVKRETDDELAAKARKHSIYQDF